MNTFIVSVTGLWEDPSGNQTDATFAIVVAAEDLATATAMANLLSSTTGITVTHIYQTSDGIIRSMLTQRRLVPYVQPTPR